MQNMTAGDGGMPDPSPTSEWQEARLIPSASSGSADEREGRVIGVLPVVLHAVPEGSSHVAAGLTPAC